MAIGRVFGDCVRDLSSGLGGRETCTWGNLNKDDDNEKVTLGKEEVADGKVVAQDGNCQSSDDAAPPLDLLFEDFLNIYSFHG